ncbi:MAG: asparagine synthase (glutamine-hydrolyzing) [Candidatus Melainabacteria bacterium HGW-Melainabacteria-1]|nr:MAG: asparagine synthase (glutamine-hydrolyzing) [Candidatus Melainabacteria bacterium HGW-Melainabacteria-1]
MCGIAGIFHFAPVSDQDGKQLAALLAMMNAVAHRGPDQDGIFADEGCLLGHRRLSILDLSESGRQPMVYADRYVLVYNGEIYNYLDLRRQLTAAGYHFLSDSDSEVLLAAFAHWGPDCQQYLSGMWAFLIYDRQNRSLFVSRDRFGIKPLYYWISPAGLVAFASEIKQFTVLPGWQAKANPQRLYDYLAWNLIDHTDETLFNGVFQLPGGSCVTLSRPDLSLSGRLSPKIWYRPEPQAFDGDRLAATAQFQSLFEKAISEHLQADVPVGSCLSGGLDSSAIVCMIHHLRKIERQLTFSAIFPGTTLDESTYIQAVVKKCSLEGHTTLGRPEELIDVLPRLIWHQDEPTGSASVYVQWQVFALAAEHGVKVMLDGQGADEVLGGYHYFIARLLTQTLQAGRFGDYLTLQRSVQAFYGYKLWQILRWSLNLLLPEWLRQPLRRHLGLASARPAWLAGERFGIVPGDPKRPFEKDARNLKELSQSEVAHTRLPMLLHREDRNAMAHSIEARVPFLDHHLVEFLLGLPDEIRLHQGQTKHVLREAMQPLLPEIINQRRDKLGFEPPEASWMRQLPAAWLQKQVVSAYEQSSGLLEPSVIKTCDQIIHQERPYDNLLWRVINLGLWMENFSVRF